MKILGITGGVGSGKSEVLSILEKEHGAYVCQMDEVAKELQKKGTDCFIKIVGAFGNTVVGADGELDRKELGRIVFSDRLKLDLLNSIVHPEVFREVRRRISEKRAEGIPLFVVESALLTGADFCDELWYVYADEKVRRERLKSSRGYRDEQITKMIGSQPSEKRFRECCDVVIDNSGTQEDTKRQIGERLKL